MGVLCGVLLFGFALSTFLSHGACGKEKSKIVFITVPMANSPYFNTLELAEEMGRRGHEVSILTTKYLKKKKSEVKHIDYQLSNEELGDRLFTLMGDVTHNFGPVTFVNTIRDIMEFFVDSCFAILKNKDTLKEIQEADMIVTISVMTCSYYIADIFDKPTITLHPGPLYLITPLTGAPSLPSLVPTAAASLSDEMTFLERTQNFFMYQIKDTILNLGVSYTFRGLQAAYDWKSNGSFSEVFGKTEMVIILVDFSYQYVNPFMPNTFYAGPILPKPSKGLPNHIEDFMESSGEHGVVLLAFGSAACDMDKVIVERILTAISKMKQKFIWKLKSTENLKIPPNLMALDWVPQNDILGHKKTKAFVSHMGINGAAEAAFHGVPIVAAPFKGERFHNAILFTKRIKMAKFVDIVNADADTWQKTIEEVIYNESYKEHAMMTSKRMRSWSKSSAERAGDLVQYTLDNGGRLPHLKSNANSLYWFQYYCVDVVAFLIAVLILVLCVFCKAMRLLFSLVCGSKSKSKKD